MDDFKKLLIPLLVAALVIIFVGLWSQGKLNLGTTSSTSQVTKDKQVIIGGTSVKVTLADTSEKRGAGLSGKESLPENEGLLFVFDQENVQPFFWMKGMLIPIDILWINDGKVIQIDEGVQPPSEGASDMDLERFTPNEPVDYVLEVNSGFSKDNNIKVGQKVEFKI